MKKTDEENLAVMKDYAARTNAICHRKDVTDYAKLPIAGFESKGQLEYEIFDSHDGCGWNDGWIVPEQITDPKLRELVEIYLVAKQEVIDRLEEFGIVPEIWDDIK